MKVWPHSWLLIGILFTLASCGEPPPRLNYLLDEGVILAFGDSLTQGVGAKQGESYPDVLAQLTQRRVINAGVSGEISEEGRKRLPEILDQTQPQLLILCHGGNDILRRKSASETKENLQMMIQLAKDRGIDVVLIGVPEFALFLLESAPYYQELSEQFHVPFEGEILPALEADSDMKSDRVHLNAEGYHRLAAAIYELLTQHGAL